MASVESIKEFLSQSNSLRVEVLPTWRLILRIPWAVCDTLHIEVFGCGDRSKLRTNIMGSRILRQAPSCTNLQVACGHIGRDRYNQVDWAIATRHGARKCDQPVRRAIGVALGHEHLGSCPLMGSARISRHVADDAILLTHPGPKHNFRTLVFAQGGIIEQADADVLGLLERKPWQRCEGLLGASPARM